MLKYIVFSLSLIFAAQAQAEIVNYVTSSQENLNSDSNSGVRTVIIEDDFMADLDLIAAKHGDDHAMGTLAYSCLQKREYECAYKWSGIALRGFYWKQMGTTDKIKDIQKSAKEQLSVEQISELDDIIKNFRPEQ